MVIITHIKLLKMYHTLYSYARQMIKMYHNKNNLGITITYSYHIFLTSFVTL